ncbi:restriction endonuclease subunit S [Mangrovactinospora gilvigrisea]|uniref:restriction endonuclease subunit S n=1 Tax=Mangrovactinospora gilvigrisea TaxID=1428644 RepID=UPI001114E305|nr:hypothetical protein [Mangrovactinospora gilvigrisea]
MEFLLKDSRLVNLFYRNSQGLVSDTWNLRYRDFKGIEVALPSTRRQRRIAEILDALDDQIRREEMVNEKMRASWRAKMSASVSILGQEADAWGSVGDYFEIQAGVTMEPGRIPLVRPHAYLRVANVQGGYIDGEDISYLELRGGDQARWQLARGDLLVVEGHASPHEIGRCARVENVGVGALYQNHLFRLRGERVDPAFGEIWLNSQHARSYWVRMCATSSGLHTINSKMLGAMPMPSVSGEMQDALVRLQRAGWGNLRESQKKVDKLKALKCSVANEVLAPAVSCRV